MRRPEVINADIDYARRHRHDFNNVIAPLMKELRHSIDNARTERQDAIYFTMIDCPIHLTHKVKLFTFGHKYAGIWECEETQLTGLCPHYDTVEERYEDDEFKGVLTVCSLCSVLVDPDRESEGFDCE
jgi:hypothetical protein